MTIDGVSLITRGRGRDTSSHERDSEGHEKEPMILTSPRRLGKGIAILVVTIAIGAQQS